MKIIFSIVIPTINSMGHIERLVDSILNQEFKYEYELIIMDSSSTDGTVDFLKKKEFKNIKIINVPTGEFNHSATRMKATKIAEGDYMIFFTHDIIPIGNQFLKNLVRPVLNGKAVASYGVFQIDKKTCDPIDAYLHNKWYKGFDDITGPISKYCWEKFSPELRRKLSNFDDCSSCIKRDILLELRFPSVPYGEDMLFAKKLLLNGYKIALSKSAKFYHWHRVSFSYLMKRMCIDQHLSIIEYNIYYVNRKIGVIKAILIRVLHRSCIALFKLNIPLKKKIYWSFYNIKTLSADFIGKYIGTLNENLVKNSFSPLNKRLLKLKNKIIDDIYRNSLGRF